MSIKNYFNSIALNNEGCEYLECGDFQTARKCFRDALQFMTVAMVKAQKEMEGQIQPFYDGERISELQWSVLPKTPLHISPDAYVYQRGVFIYRDDDDFPEPSAFELSDESSMIVYNLGLSFHLLGTSTNKSALLNEALSFYKIAEAIRSPRRTHTKKNPELIDLAIYNNMGQVFYEQVHFEQACMCFRVLKSALICFSHQGLVDFLTDEDSDGFVLNASIQGVTLAAAA
jgi:tetratricopeptide (TPR) repeat protein